MWSLGEKGGDSGRWIVRADGEEGPGLRDDGDARLHVVLGGAPFRAAAVALIGGRCGVFSGFGQSFLFRPLDR